MTLRAQLAVIGAGPAGLAAAVAGAKARLSVVVIDEQPAAGGQIYRGITRANRPLLELLGADYAAGMALSTALADAGVQIINGATVFEVTRARDIYYTRDGRVALLEADHIILATGAIERPMPFPGWTLPGVMSAGGAQILLKTSGLAPGGQVVLAGSGPLLLLLASQLLRAGGRIAALIETTPRDNWRQALRHLPRAMRAHEYLRKGMALLHDIRRHGVPHYRHASNLVAVGSERIEQLRFRCERQDRSLPCELLLLHTGVVPNVQLSRALDLEHAFDSVQRCWRPHVGPWGECALDGMSIAGDGAGIGGAQAAEHAGRLAALHAAASIGTIGAAERDARALLERRALRHHLAVRPFLDALYAPAAEFLSPSDETIVCRCEEVTAGAVRGFVKLGCLGPNQTKSFGRPGMGPCQGRFCGLTVSEIIAAERGVRMDEVGYYRIRPPIKPITIGELAAMDAADV